MDNVEIKSNEVALKITKPPTLIENAIYGVSSGLIIFMLINGLSWVLGVSEPHNHAWVISIACAILIFLDALTNGKLGRLVFWMALFWLMFIGITTMCLILAVGMRDIIEYLHQSGIWQ